MLFAQINQGAAGWMQTTAGSWYVLTEAGSTTALSLFVIASMTPSLLLNPVGGRLMQSYSPVTMVKVLAPLAALAPLLIAGLYATGSLSIPLLFVLTVVGASFRALQAPTFAKILPLTVPESQRAAVLGYSAIAFNVSRSVGPVIAGLAGTGPAYLLSGIGFLVVAAIMFFTPLGSAQPTPATTASQGAAPKGSSFRRALRLMWSITAVRILFLCVIVFYLVSGSIHQLLAAVAKDTSTTSLALGALYACAAIGAIFTNRPVLRYLRNNGNRTRLLSIVIVAAALTVVAFGFSSGLIFDMVLMVILGALGEATYLVVQRSILLELDEADSGAIFGLFLAILTGASILGSIGLGLLMDAVGVRSGLVMLGVVTLVIAVPLVLLVAQASSKPRQESTDD
jgi:MFS family permease